MRIFLWVFVKWCWWPRKLHFRNGVEFFCSRRFLLCFFKLVQLRINTACVSAGVDSCMNSCRWFAKLERAATSVARSTTLPGCGWHHNAYPPETTAGGSVFREAVSKTLPASASDQRNAFPEVIKIPESKATAFQTLDSAVYSFNRTVGEIILDAVKNSCHVLLQGGDGCVHVLTRTTVVFQNINEPLPVFSFSALNTSWYAS